MRIAVLHGSNDSYGATRVLAQEAECLVRLGHHLTVFVPHDGPLAHELAHLGDSVRVVVDPGLSVLRRSRLRDVLRPPALRPEMVEADLVVLWTLALAVYIPVLRLRHKRFYVSVHELLLGTMGGLLVRALLAPGAFPVCACSTATADWLGANGVHRRRLTVIFPIFEPVERLPERAAHEPPTIAVVGRVNGHKGHLEVVRALHEGIPDGVPWRLLLCGAPFPGQEDALTDVLTAVDSNPRIQYRGEVSSLAAIAPEIDAVLCFPTTPEPFGLVPVEAWRLGLRAVGYGDGGAAEVLRIVGGIAVTRTDDAVSDVRTALAALDHAMRLGDELAAPATVNPQFGRQRREELLRGVIRAAVTGPRRGDRGNRRRF
ncbi:glycosyltransferase family 4 protein [Cryobacterium psychrophilum]|uniref:Glycosyltransferase n=1 Tax=Cryobacterium psychrophilum TaxID=41988 RepID=A0A4Y8KJX2_9MICO|nr:glycosyltransferase family 4 protein [Cryobacterium psychrophilum]TDW29961.1 glycosyltransferase involved in cell wall biosynthesis [Cryobacterium psychrophilum]TFD76522.1 glycosyltransferase [Cryobacterium psychrophilum]